MQAAFISWPARWEGAQSCRDEGRLEPAMYALMWLLPITLAMAGGGLALFLWCTRSGQFEDLEGAAWRILQDDKPHRPSRREPDHHEG
ncbi:cbb3-type cytochrome oxidase assembly protein CcoS [Sabulicella rubraurantiaca]|uniref:cbb3-type cytochrome oxidase assembly protein CcoS n=1 Tax=Sabulicella rubraurantiaca TaxID=2811429 RepID=UPI001F29DEA1|nr:cbb3-type cytochrome oxidase assembly protein CcoS [Sabulicella rubraurantiaca]